MAASCAPALRFDRVWHELRAGPGILRGVSLDVGPGERVALMGRNGAGKSTLLRHAAGLMKPTRGRVETAGRVALLLQNPNDYLIHETVAAGGAGAALDPGRAGRGARAQPPRPVGRREAAAGARDRARRRRQRCVCLDEPTRGHGPRPQGGAGRLLDALDAAVIVATHDPEFVAAFAERVVLLADGAPIADGAPAEILAGGSYFATETARILGGRRR